MLLRARNSPKNVSENFTLRINIRYKSGFEFQNNLHDIFMDFDHTVLY